MSQTNPPRVTPPSPAQLLAGYLQRQSEADAAGLAAPDLGGEVLPYEAGPVQPIDARPAWEEAVAVVRFFTPAQEPKGWQAPPHWPQLVAAHEPAADLAFCVGNFPQLVRDLHLLLQADRSPAEPRSARAPLLAAWGREAASGRRFPQALLGLGALRLAGQLDAADEVVRSLDANVPVAWRPAWDNEKAALTWHRGQRDEALAAWQAQPASVPVVFNHGMAALFLGRPVEALPLLREAAARIPETSAWHHLAQLYLTLAETRG
jgi:hypothetical protein